jgi:hypothetical protein
MKFGLAPTTLMIRSIVLILFYNEPSRKPSACAIKIEATI